VTLQRLCQALLLLCLLSGLPATLAAQDGPPPLRDYAIDVWTSRNGLPHNSLRDIAQTPEGHLWFATWEGLVRYNGLDFTVFDRSTRPGLRDNGVGALFVDRDGGLWGCQYHGSCLLRYDRHGHLTDQVLMPVPCPTSCCFGGEGMNTLFISTARLGMSAEDLQHYPDAGDLYAINPEIGGIARHTFKE